MIFVTVGTHEQNFNRLIKKIDNLREQNIIKDKVFIQTGYTDYEPKHCEFKNMITNDEMIDYTKKAKIVITHGGPGSIMLPFQYGKIPVVVPRQKDFDEHVDNHQVKFTNKLESENKVIAIYDINKLGEVINNYDSIVESFNKDYKSNTTLFVDKLENICNNLVNK